MRKQILSFKCLFGDRISSLDFPKHMMTLNPWPLLPTILSARLIGVHVSSGLC